MASGPSEPRSPRRPPDDDDPRAPRQDPETGEEPRIRHTPPGPGDDRARGLPVASPWGMPPFASPTPDDDMPEPPKGRRPYSSPTAPSEAEPQRPPRRIVDRPDKLVATGPPRPDPEPIPVQPEIPAEPEHLQDTQPVRVPRTGHPYRRPPEPREEAEEQPTLRWGDAPPPEPETGEAAGQDDGDGEVRRVGRPPGGRPTRPDRLVAESPPRSGTGGRHHRGPAPSATRRSSPVRGPRRLAAPLAVALALAIVAGFFLYQWWDSATETGLRLVAGAGRSGDEQFTVPSAGDGSNQMLLDMTSVGRTVVAVGSDTTSPVPRPLFLFSPDSGRTWQLGKVTDSATAIVQRVVGGNGRWLAIGGDATGDQRGLWTSTDGFGWAAVEPGGLAAFRKGDLIHDIARTASGFVAVGKTTLQNGSPGPAAWHSPDGRAWQRVDSGEIGTPDKVREFRAVVARGDAVVVLAQPAEGDSSVIMRSPDGGKTWVRTAAQLQNVTPRPGALAVLPDTFVLVPTRQRAGTGDVRVYCSAVGAEWSQCGSIGGIPAQSTGITTVVSHSSGIAALSQSGLDSFAVFSSTDGRAWAKRDLGRLAGATVRGLTVSDTGTLVLGGDQAAAEVDNQLVLMTAAQGGPAARVPLGGIEGLSRSARETARVAAAGGRYVAVGSASGDAAIWTSSNGQSWKPFPLAAPRHQALTDVAHGRRGWLAVGSTMPDPSSTDPLLVTGSNDARTWKKAGGNGALARADGQPYLAAQAVAAGAKGYVIAGQERRSSGTAGAVMWFTADLDKYTRAKKLPQNGTEVTIHDVAATAKGYLAVGGSGAGERESGVVWFSPDGVNWKSRERVVPSGATAAGLREVVVHGERIVAIGSALVPGGRKVFAAVSADDGDSWQISWLPAEQAAAVHDLAAAGQGLVAVGWHGPPGGGDSAAWTSEDGLTWARQDLTTDSLGGEGLQWLGAVAVDGTKVLALGRSTTYQADHLILWTSTLAVDR